MPPKVGSKPIYVDGKIQASFKAKLAEEGWTWGITKKVETLMKDYVEGKLTRLEEFTGPVDARKVHLSGVPLPPTVGVYQVPEKQIPRKGRVGEHPSKGRHTGDE